jgi:RNA polymerase sigma factor (sigma-70 family)
MSGRNDGREVLEAAYRRYSDYVFGVCLKFATGDRGWALDRSHDVFIRLHENLKSLQLDADLRPWLRKVAVNECLMDLRRRERRQRLLRLFGGSPEQSVARPERDAALRRDVVALDRALAALPASKGQASKLHQRALATLARGEWESDA